jgi:hypothetical protein
MESETQFITFLAAPWVVLIVALVFYRRRRIRKARDADTISGTDTPTDT